MSCSPDLAGFERISSQLPQPDVVEPRVYLPGEEREDERSRHVLMAAVASVRGLQEPVQELLDSAERTRRMNPEHDDASRSCLLEAVYF